MSELRYLTGFGNEHASEAVPGTLPIGQNSPKRVAHGLYNEQLSGTAFTVPRARNRRSWLYRIRPSVLHSTGATQVDRGLIRTAPSPEAVTPSTQLRWDPFPSTGGGDWLDGLATIATNGNAAMQAGGAVHHYVADRSMGSRVFVNMDGELMITPYDGSLLLRTEMGHLTADPGHMIVIPRGVKFSVDLTDGAARGYVCENYGSNFELPEPGPIGLNAMAMPRDFEFPAAAYDDTDAAHTMIAKSSGHLWASELGHSPLDVVAWHGNLAPFRYELRRYCPVGPTLFDHPDPSIWTVMTSESERQGMANIDFILFREQWRVAENTFRPPWFHSNVMSELMGLIDGIYDAKAEGFHPGGMSIHNAFIPHGPDAQAYEAGTTAGDEPSRSGDSLGVMWESRYRWEPTAWALGLTAFQTDYPNRWSSLDRHFES
jgi:homogentisate 1,2-dioxygenase